MSDELASEVIERAGEIDAGTRKPAPMMWDDEQTSEDGDPLLDEGDRVREERPPPR